MVLSLLSFSRRPRTCNILPKLLGIYLHASGAKRRVLGVLNAMGVCSSYMTINRAIKTIARQTATRLAKAHTWSNLSVIYDNFNYNEKVGRQTQGHHNEIKNVTSGLLIKCSDIPDGGLLQSMLDTTIPLNPQTVFLAPGLRYDNVQRDVSISPNVRTCSK